jgi:hypothetical protein
MRFDAGAPPPQPTSSQPPMVVDPPPPDMPPPMVVDPPPPDMSRPVTKGLDAGAPGKKKTGADGGTSALDPEPLDHPGSLGVPDAEREIKRLKLIDQWFDTSPKATARSVDLPLYDPPRPKLVGRREGERVRVRIEGVRGFSTRWEADGKITRDDGDGGEIRWEPAGPSDRVRVAIRTRGGVSVLSMRSDEVGSGRELL